MKEIQLTQGKIALVDDEDFEYLNQWKWRFDRYACRSDSRKNNHIPLLMHRIIMNPLDGLTVDHINNNKLDNRRCNLRICSISENARNRGAQSDNTSGYKGVTKGYKNKWVAQIKLHVKSYRYDGFNSKEDAAREYDRLAISMHGEFAHLNFPKS